MNILPNLPRSGTGSIAVLVIEPRLKPDLPRLVDADFQRIEPLLAEIVGCKSGPCVDEESAESHLPENPDLAAQFIFFKFPVPRPERQSAACNLSSHLFFLILYRFSAVYILAFSAFFSTE